MRCSFCYCFLFLYSCFGGVNCSQVDVSVIITVAEDQMNLITGSLFALNFALTEYSHSRSVGTEVLLVPIGGTWGDNSRDSLDLHISQASMARNSMISAIKIIEIDTSISPEHISGHSLAYKINTAVSQSNGDILLFLTHNTQVELQFLQPLLFALGKKPSEDTLRDLREKYRKISQKLQEYLLNNESNEFEFNCEDCKVHSLGVGIVGGKQQSTDGKLLDAGVDFRFHKVPNAAVTHEQFIYRESEHSEETSLRSDLYTTHVGKYCPKEESVLISSQEAPLPILRWTGECSEYYPASVSQNVPALSGTFLAMHKSIFQLVGGLDCAYEQERYDKGRAIAFIDLSIFMRILGWEIRFIPSSVSYLAPNDGSDLPTKDRNLFVARWRERLAEEVERNYHLKDIQLIYRMECGTSGTLGFTVEAINILQGLEALMPISAGSSDARRCIKHLNEAGIEQHKIDLLERLFDRVADNNREKILFIHKDPGRVQGEINRVNESPFYVIGRAMYETDSIPERWKTASDRYLDEIWVPSQFNVETFSNGGIDPAKLRVIGECVDIHSFDPQLPPSRFRVNAELYTSSENDNRKFDSSLFTYLSVMKFEFRKGWKELIKAFIEEFDEHEPVQLVIRSSIMHYEERDLKSVIKEAEEAYGRGPPIFFIKDIVPFEKLKELYNIAGAVVSASHGEGWGLPLMEAMAMQKPTVALNWSGNTEFMNSNNSFLVDVEELRTEGSPVPDSKWAFANISHLKEQLRFIYENQDYAIEVAKRGREDIIAFWDIPKLAERLVLMLKEIADNREYYKKLNQLRNMIQLDKEPEKQIAFDVFDERQGNTFYSMKILKNRSNVNFDK